MGLHENVLSRRLNCLLFCSTQRGRYITILNCLYNEISKMCNEYNLKAKRSNLKSTTQTTNGKETWVLTFSSYFLRRT